MTSNMTDNEIIKALECCCEAKLNEDCKKLKCPFFDYEIGNCTNVGDMDAMYRFALDLINRQNAEIERLKKDSKRLKKAQMQLDDLCKMHHIIKAEAYKEFAERLKANFKPLNSPLIENRIDNLLKNW